ncbi:MAG: hypothetical protein RR840_02695 [Clostridium sp.]
MKKICLVIIGCIFFILVLGGCDSKATEALEQAKVEVKSKEYNQALNSLNLALKENPEHEEAKILYSIINSYFDAKKMIDNDKFNEANKVLVNINPVYKRYFIKGDIELLISQVDNRIKEIEQNKNSLNVISKLIDEKNYSEAKSKISSIDINKLTEDQKVKITELDYKVNEEIARVEADKKKKNAVLEMEKVNSKGNKDKISEDEAGNLLVKYLRQNGTTGKVQWMVDSETESEFVIQVFSDGNNSIATSGWYTVSKKNGEVKSEY